MILGELQNIIGDILILVSTIYIHTYIWMWQINTQIGWFFEDSKKQMEEILLEISTHYF